MGALLAPEQRSKVEALLRENLSDNQVALRAGVSRATVARYRRQLGLPRFLVNADSPACRHGHPFPENRGFHANGWLYCRGCSRACVRTRRYRAVEPDEMAIERAVAGDPPERLTPRERAAAVRKLDQKGLSAAEIAERVRCTQRNVHYLRSTFRRAA